MGVALKYGNDVVAFEELRDLAGVAEEEAVQTGDGLVGGGFGGSVAGWSVLGGGGDEGDVRDDQDGCCGGGGGDVVSEPGELIGVDHGVEVALGSDLDGVEEDEVVAPVVEGAIGFGVEALLEGFFAVEGVRGGDVCAGVAAEDVVIADDVVDGDSVEGVLGFLIKLEEQERAFAGDGGEVEAVVSALDAEVGLEGLDLAEGECGAFGGGEFGLGVGVGEEDEAEGAGLGGGRSGLGCRLGGGGESGGGGCGGGEGEKAAAVEGAHGCDGTAVC